MANNNYSLESSLFCDSIDSCNESSLNKAMLITSMDNLPESETTFSSNSSCPKIATDPTVKKTKTVAEILKRLKPELCASNIETMTQILSHTTDGGDSNLCESFEELTSTSIEKSILWPSLTALQKCFVKSNDCKTKNNDELIDDLHEMYEEDPHNFTEHLLTIIEETSDLSVSASSKDSFKIKDASDSLDSTRYMNFNDFDRKVKNKGADSMEKSPMNLASFAGHAYSFETPRSLSTRPGTPGRLEKPRIIVTPGTPEIREDNLQLPNNECDDDNYVTAESDVNEAADTTIVDSEMSKNETLNLSKVASRHREWVESFDKVYRYNPINRKVTNYKSKLEKRWFRELAKKRQKCFDSVNNLLEQAAMKKSQECNEESQCVCHRCKRQIEFFNTIVTCSEYYSYALDKNVHGKRSKSIEKKGHCAVTKSRVKSIDDKVSSSCGQNTTKKVSTKSSGNKVKTTGRKFKSPRRSVAAKSFVRKSPRRNIVKPTSEIDTSSIRPVAALRAIFSPNTKISGSMQSINFVPRQAGSRMYVSKLSVTPSSSSKMYKSPASTFATARSKFQHVKSPVGEYIKGKK